MVKRHVPPPPLLVLAVSTALVFYSLSAFSGNTALLSKCVSLLSILPLGLGGLAIVAAATPDVWLAWPKVFNRALAADMAAAGVGFFIAFGALPVICQAIAWGQPASDIAGAVVVILDDPRVTRGGNRSATVALNQALSSDGTETSASGELRLFFPSGFEADRGDTLQVIGKYHTDGQPYFTASEALVLRERGQANKVRGSIRAALIERLGKTGWGALAAALLLAHKDNLAEGEAEAFTEAGCAHVLALSGMHLAVIAAAVALLLKKALGFRASVVGSFFVCAAYVALAGTQAALIRSLIMYAFHSWAVLRGRQAKLAYLLSAAFLIQLCLDPRGACELSFTLSYAALAGIALWGGAADELASGILPAILRPSVAASFGAFLATAPIIASVFGVLRPIGLIVGIFVALLAEAIMIAAMVWLPIAFIFPPLAKFLSMPIQFLYQLCTEVTRLAARVPGINVDAMLTIGVGLAVGALLLYLRYRLYEWRHRIEPISQL